MSKILVVDDDQGTTKLLENILSKEGYDVITLNDSVDTVSVAAANEPNLILLDMMMPFADGIEVFNNLRAESQFAQVPIVFFTSVNDIQRKVAALESGASDYIVKPVHPQELKLRIKALIGNHG
ncbi:MAG TPA: response regulator [Anaerolineales bacterium]|nr:response regulator [Anaerolineales bacterium]